MKIAVFGDIHGRIKKMYYLISEWQVKNRQKIDLVLQVGDLGVFPDHQKLDSATAKKSKENPEELGFYDFFKGNESIQSIYGDKLNEISSKTIFVGGNHEDYDYINNLTKKESDEALVPVDKLKNILYLKNASPIVLYGGDGTLLRIGGLGGINPESRPKQVRKNPSISYDADVLAESIVCENVDIFMSHMHPKEGRDDGDHELSDLIELIQPKFYFFGHASNRTSFNIGNTACYGLGRVLDGSLDENRAAGAVKILEKEDNELKILEY